LNTSAVQAALGMNSIIFLYKNISSLILPSFAA
jgi:hypothetical protein